MMSKTLCRARATLGLALIGSLVLLTTACASALPAATGGASSPPNASPSVGKRADMFPDLNYLHTEGARIVDSKGNEVKITGISWFGMETDTLAPHGLWARGYKEMLDDLVKLGYNTIRLPFSNELFNRELEPRGIDYAQNPDLKGLSGLEILDKIVTAAGERGLKIILDQHRPTTDSQSKLWYSDELGEKQWIDDWTFLARRYLGNDTIVGADLHNEPAGDATWGDGNPQTDWRMAAEKAGNAILDVNPHWLIIVEGIEKTEDDFGNVMDWYWMGGSLQYARIHPVRLKVPNQLVYSAHDYGPGVYLQGWFQDPDFPENLPEVWDHHWGYLAKEGIAPVILGEFGGKSVGNDLEGIWQQSLVKYLKESGIGYLYWSFNGNSGDTGGILKDDWKSIDTAKQAMLATYQDKMIPSVSPKTVDASVQPGPRPEVKAVKALHKDLNERKWSTALLPEVHIANRTLEPMDVSNFEARYWFAADGAAEKYEPGSQIVEITSVRIGDKNVDSRQAKAELVADPNGAKEIDPIYYVKVTLAPGTIVTPRESVAVGLRIYKKDGSTYFQENDFSRREYHWQTEWDRVTLYKDGHQVWGIDPYQHEAKEKQKLEERQKKLAEKQKK